jgi:hypothetical protein
MVQTITLSNNLSTILKLIYPLIRIKTFFPPLSLTLPIAALLNKHLLTKLNQMLFVTSIVNSCDSEMITYRPIPTMQSNFFLNIIKVLTCNNTSYNKYTMRYDNLAPYTGYQYRDDVQGYEVVEIDMYVSLGLK